jgi:hypothetical protein
VKRLVASAAWVLVPLGLALTSGCKHAQSSPCTLVTESETSNGVYTYVVSGQPSPGDAGARDAASDAPADGGSRGAADAGEADAGAFADGGLDEDGGVTPQPNGTVHGDLGPTTMLMVGSGDSDYVGTFEYIDGCPAGPVTKDTVIVSGDFLDTSGQPEAFCLQLNDVAQGGPNSLGPGSVVCLDGGSPCAPLTGTLTATTFSTNCISGGPCELTLEGTLHASASWPGGRFEVGLDLGHQDSCQ